MKRGLGGGRCLGGQSKEDYGFENLAKSPGLYLVLKLRNLNICGYTVYFLGPGGFRSVYGWRVVVSVRGGRTMGLRSS